MEPVVCPHCGKPAAVSLPDGSGYFSSECLDHMRTKKEDKVDSFKQLKEDLQGALKKLNEARKLAAEARDKSKKAFEAVQEAAVEVDALRVAVVMVEKQVTKTGG